jgi:hypothetical protein
MYKREVDTGAEEQLWEEWRWLHHTMTLVEMTDDSG